MIRKSFVMPLFPACHDQYIKRHNPIWSELAVTLKAHGVHHYSIFLDKTRHLLFGYVLIESESRWDEMAQTDVCQRWWQSMSELMPSHEDHRPKSDALSEVFYLE